MKSLLSQDENVSVKDVKPQHSGQQQFESKSSSMVEAEGNIELDSRLN